MTGFNQIERGRRTAIYIRISTSQQQTDRQAEILMDRSLVKEYINEYIQDIVMYNPSALWILVIIHFVDGSERWGTIKKGKHLPGQEKRYESSTTSPPPAAGWENSGRMNFRRNAMSSPIMIKFAKMDILMAKKNDNIETFEPLPRRNSILCLPTRKQSLNRLLDQHTEWLTFCLSSATGFSGNVS